MSFAAPLVLLALVALPLLTLLYLAEQRRRRAAATAFAAPVLQPSVVPSQPGWRRHVPIIAFGLALAVLILAMAKPQRTVAVPVERASIMLASDISGSMTATDVRPSRLAAAKRAEHRFVEEVPPRVNVGLEAFNHNAQVLQSPTRDRQAIRAAIDGMRPNGGTATGEAIAMATGALGGANAERRNRPPAAAILLLSDGASTSGRDPLAAARDAARLEIPIYTVVLGTEQGTITATTPSGGTQTKRVPPDPAALAQIAQVSGGKAYTAATATDLKEIYESLGSQLGHEKKKRQITSAFAGGGLVLLLAGIGMSMRWFGRFI